jgi:hypothetical protein
MKRIAHVVVLLAGLGTLLYTMGAPHLSIG